MIKRFCVATLLVIVVAGCETLQQQPPVADAEVASPAPVCVIPADPYFLVVSDIHLNLNHTTASEYNNDTGTDLYASVEYQIGAILGRAQPPDFVIYLGDLPAHTNATPPTDHKPDIGAVLKGLRTKAQNAPNVPLLYLPGNNDSVWGDYCIFSDTAGAPPPPYGQDTANAVAWPGINTTQCGTTGGKCLLNDDGKLAERRLAGYYSAYPTDDRKLRIVMMNTVMFSGSSCWCLPDASACGAWTTRHSDGDTQLGWLKTQLDDAKTNQEKVLIAMHIPPGKDEYCKSDGTTHKGVMWSDVNQQNTFLEHVGKHQDVIVGVLTSHTHMDEIRVLHDSNGPSALAVSAPGISPNHGQNPGLKIVHFDRGNTWELTDFTTHYAPLPLSAAPAGGSKDATGGWANNCYSFRSSYDCAASDTSMFDCVRSKTPSELYSGLESTLQVKRGTPGCDVSGILNVDYTGP